jgi:hypothetical protein
MSKDYYEIGIQAPKGKPKLEMGSVLISFYADMTIRCFEV